MDHLALVAHLDVLGFSRIVNKSSASRTVVKTGEMFSNTFKNATSWLPRNLISIKTFSDNICISRTVGERPNFLEIFQFIGSIAQIQTKFINNQEGPKLFIRGGSCYGVHFQDDNTIVSPPFIRAYEIESNEAVNPRVVLDESFIEVFNKTLTVESNTFLAEIGSLALTVDYDDNKTFINYLTWAIAFYLFAHEVNGAPVPEKFHHDVISVILRTHKFAIEANLKEADSKSVVLKMKWATSYHNHVVGTIKNSIETLVSISKNPEVVANAVSAIALFNQSEKTLKIQPESNFRGIK